MPSSRLFWKLLLACAGLNLLATVALALFFSSWAQDRIVAQVDRRLRDAAYLLRGELDDQLEAGPSDSLQRRVRRLGKETKTRFTLISRDGTVLADSGRASLDAVRALGSHRDRPEIVQARTRGEGSSSRASETLAKALRYYAVRVDVDGELVGFVRSSLPLAAVEGQVADAREMIWALAAAMFVLVTLLSYWIIGRILRPLALLTKAADAIASGDYRHRAYVASGDEFEALARALDRVGQDLSARTTQLGQTGDRQSTVLGGMIEGVIAVDGRQRVVLANGAAGRLFEFRPSAAEGRPLLEVVRSHALHEAVMAALATRQPRRLETKREGAEKMSVNIHVQPLPGAPCPGVVLVMHDTTELRRLESLRSDFVANVSHELKTPLSSIKAYAETLRNGALGDPETSHRFLARIEEQADRLHHLIMDMLMLARIESDQQAFEIVAVDVSQVVASCLEDYRRAAEAKRIQLIVESDGSPCRVRADREGLREILDNLVDNAIKYTPEGGSVTISWRCEQASTGEREGRSEEQGATQRVPGGEREIIQKVPGEERVVRITVRDTGIGIKPEHQRRVFERFYRVDKARSRELGGTGLGLSIVKHLAQAFGGAVSVESEPKRGSAFTVELPVG